MDVDIAIIGAGIAGASMAAFLPDGMRVALLEAEHQPGYHSTGRSAAFYTETYGGPEVQPLTTASKRWYFSTKSHSTDALMVAKRGALHVAWSQKPGALKGFAKEMQHLAPSVMLLSSDETRRRCPVLNGEALTGGVWDPDCCDIDVAEVHSYFLRECRHRGHSVATGFDVQSARRGNGVWHLQSSKGDSLTAALVVNAAGAWADQIAAIFGVSPLGLTPMRRTIALFEVSGAVLDERLPLCLDFDERFYFKPQSGQLLVSPADETHSPPCDVQPDVEDIALAGYRVEQATRLTLPRCAARWAGLRTFAPDRSPVYGFDQDVPGFFWCAGQGGFGIQTAPAAGELAACLLQDKALPDAFGRLGITAERYAPRRFALAA